MANEVNVAMDMRDYIVSNLPNKNYDSIAFVDSMPALYNESFCVYNNGGLDDNLVFNDDGNIINKYIKIISRAMDPETSYNLLEDITQLLKHEIINKTINSTYYINCYSKSQIIPMGQDSKGRFEYSANYLIRYQEFLT